MMTDHPDIPHYEEDDLLVFSQSVAIYLCKHYCCAGCYHKWGKATILHRTQKPKDGDFDRFEVFCTECGENVAARGVGRISIWFLTKHGQQLIERALEIKEYDRRLEVERLKQAGLYTFDEDAAIKALGF